MKLQSISTITLLILYFLCSISSTQAQKLIDDTKTLKVLVFENQEKDKKKLISQSGRVKYKLRNDPKKLYKGTLDDIKEGAMVVNGVEVPFKDCLMISGRVNTEEVLIGGICIGTGFSSIVFGLALTSNIAVGGVFMGVGVAALITGLVLVTKSKRFNLDKGWDVHSGQIIYSATE